MRTATGRTLAAATVVALVAVGCGTGPTVDDLVAGDQPDEPDGDGSDPGDPPREPVGDLPREPVGDPPAETDPPRATGAGTGTFVQVLRDAGRYDPLVAAAGDEQTLVSAAVELCTALADNPGSWNSLPVSGTLEQVLTGMTVQRARTMAAAAVATICPETPARFDVESSEHFQLLWSGLQNRAIGWSAFLSSLPEALWKDDTARLRKDFKPLWLDYSVDSWDQWGEHSRIGVCADMVDWVAQARDQLFPSPYPSAFETAVAGYLDELEEFASACEFDPSREWERWLELDAAAGPIHATVPYTLAGLLEFPDDHTFPPLGEPPDDYVPVGFRNAGQVIATRCFEVTAEPYVDHPDRDGWVRLVGTVTNLTADDFYPTAWDVWMVDPSGRVYTDAIRLTGRDGAPYPVAPGETLEWRAAWEQYRPHEPELGGWTTVKLRRIGLDGPDGQPLDGCGDTTFAYLD